MPRACPALTVAGAPASAGKKGGFQVISDTGAYALTLDTSKLIFTYQDAGKVTKVDPVKGQYGTAVTITGEKLFGTNGGTKVTGVFVNGVVGVIVSQKTTEVIFRVGRGMDLCSCNP